MTKFVPKTKIVRAHKKRFSPAEISGEGVKGKKWHIIFKSETSSAGSISYETVCRMFLFAYAGQEVFLEISDIAKISKADLCEKCARAFNMEED